MTELKEINSTMRWMEETIQAYSYDTDDWTSYSD